jgi:hypothetical protein
MRKYGLHYLLALLVLSVPRAVAQITPPPSKGGGGGAPSGPAGGSLTGTYPNPGVTTLNQNTTGTAANLSGTPALPNGTSATTQAQMDASTRLATTSYVDTAIANAVAGINPAVAVAAATIQASDTSGLTYNNGVSGVGATFTGTTNTALTIDGFTFTALGQRLLVKNDTQSGNPGAYNGIYYVTQLQTSLLPPILTRALDYDQPSDMNNTGAIPVINGTVNASTLWVLSSQVVTVGTTPLVFTQFGAVGTTPGMVQIAQQTLASPAAIVTFTGIPATYSTLKVVILARSAQAANLDELFMTINADTGSHYAYQKIQGLNSTASASATVSSTPGGVQIGLIAGASAPSGSPGAITGEIPGYAATTFTKVGVFTDGELDSVETVAATVTWFWSSAAAVNELQFGLSSNANFVTGSQFTLYGLK